MLTAIEESLPIAVGLALASVPMLLITVTLVIKRPLRHSWAFLAGWLLGLFVVGGAVVLAADLLMLGDEPADWAAYVEIVLGMVLLVLAVTRWRKRSAPADDSGPSLLDRVVDGDVRRTFVTGFALAAANPKNIVIVAAGATVIADTTALVAEQAGALAVFVVVASLGVAVPALVRMVLGRRAAPVLARADVAITRHAEAIVAVVFLALGVVVLVKGLGGL
ncbi:GAP family protein [Marmoricola sp. RAF53]|uniref:GAP family protein n=1 Tax=Marmoricola sp. RAF53 TaxID=3233059 RepID=UPI003F978B5D